MASCSQYTLAAIAQGCKDNSGGIRVVYVANYDDVSALTVDATAETITNIAMSGSAKFSKWQFQPQTATFTSTATISEENGTVFYQNDLSLVFAKVERVKRLQMLAATYGNTAVIVEDMNRKLWYMGYDNSVTASASGAEFGTAMGDANRYTLTLTDFSKELPREIDMAAADLAAIGVD